MIFFNLQVGLRCISAGNFRKALTHLKAAFESFEIALGANDPSAIAMNRLVKVMHLFACHLIYKLSHCIVRSVL